jgi:hypothetical protein
MRGMLKRRPGVAIARFGTTRRAIAGKSDARCDRLERVRGRAGKVPKTGTLTVIRG